MADTSEQVAAMRDVPYRTRSGDWVYLPGDAARHHPLYGVYAWAFFLLACLVLGPIILLYQDVRILVSVSQRPDEFWLVLAADIVFLAAAWKAAGRLRLESADFSRYFYIAAGIGLCVAALFFAVLVESGPRELDRLALSGLVWRAVPILLWTLYVLRSRRIEVTTRKRVPSSDPFLRAQWRSDGESGEPRVLRHVPMFHHRTSRDDAAASAPRGAVREPVRRPRRQAASADSDAVDETVVVHRDAAPRPQRSSSREIVETYSPRRPARPLAGAASEQARVRRPLVRQQEAGFSEELRETLPAGPTDHDRLAQPQNAELLDRLRQLQLAREEGLITASEERAKRQELLREL